MTKVGQAQGRISVRGSIWWTVILAFALTQPACVVREDSDPGGSEVALFNTIRWSTASERDNFGFDVYRAESEDGPFVKLTRTPIPGGLESDVPRDYELVDDSIVEGKVYYYYVESISLDSVRKRFTPIAVAKPKYRVSVSQSQEP